MAMNLKRTASLVAFLILMSTVVRAEAASSRLPLIMYGSGSRLGGHFPLAELALGDAEPLGPSVRREIELRSELAVSYEAVHPERLRPATTPVLLVTIAGADPIPSEEDDLVSSYVREGGFVVLVPLNEAAAQNARLWLRRAFPNEPLMELPTEQLADANEMSPSSFRPTSALSIGVDAIRVNAEIRLLMPRSARPTGGEADRRVWARFAATASLVGALRSPYVKRLSEPPIRLSAERTDERVHVTAALSRIDGPGTLTVRLTALDGREFSEERIREVAASDVPFEADFMADIATFPFDPRNYWIRAEWQGAIRLRRTVGLVDLLGTLDTEVKGQTTWKVGSPGSIRVITRNGDNGAPIVGANVRAEIVSDAKTIASVERETDGGGTAAIQFDLPDDVTGDVELRLRIRSPFGDDDIQRTITVEDARKILLTTDKPIYQPGQRMYLRAVELREADRRPVGAGTLTFEVEDAKGNKVFKFAARRNQFGIASAEFMLADEVNLGTYTVRAVDGSTTQEKSVTVDRYVLPRFKVETTLDRPEYGPGDIVTGTVSARYFFGKAVARGKVEIAASTFDVEWNTFARLTGRTDENGQYAFELDLPRHFAGLPLRKGESFVQFEVTVTDNADHRETARVSRPVVDVPFTIALIPESGDLVPGVRNRLFAVTATHEGKPLETVVTLTLGDLELMKSTDEMGVAVFEFTPASQQIDAQVVAHDLDGRRIERTIPLMASENGLLLRPEHALAKVGETLPLEVFSPRSSGWVYVDVIRLGQTIFTKSAPIDDHRAFMTIALGPNDDGTLQLHAYEIDSDGQIRRDTRLVYVEPAADLTVAIRPDRETYRPGDEGTVQFHVEDENEKPVVAAIGIQVVDESVFARQEMQPGLEKVFFLLEQELLKPRFEIHSLDPGILVRPMPEPLRESAKDRRETAAEVLFAAAESVSPSYTLDVRTERGKQAAFRNALMKRLDPVVKRVADALAKYAKRQGEPFIFSDTDLMDALVRQGYLRREDALDPWGNPLEFDGGQLKAVGPDGTLGTDDDLILDESLWSFGVREQALFRGGIGGMDVIRAAKAAGPPKGAQVVMMEAVPSPAPSAGADQASVAPTRVREFFPETLFVQPSLITDEAGNAQLTFPLADSITTWRLTAMATGLNGSLGSATGPIRVFQDFFIDLDLPVSLTVGDEVSVPIALYNYLDEQQTIRIEVERGDWFDLLGEAVTRATLQPQEVSVRYVRIRALRPGAFSLTARAYGSRMGDAVKRPIEIIPDGREVRTTWNDRLTGEISRTVSIPSAAIPGATKLIVKLYPGVFSQVVEGLDAILQMPSGCFEQTSSATYPNILALEYMRATGQNTPDVQMKAEEYIALGYQRLLSFEVDGGGFEWFGRAPANQILTAYGLIEFYDMARVAGVDPAVISRTQNWLLSRQQPDGSWRPDAAYLHAESWGRIQSNELLPTAYVVWALAETGIGPAALRGGTEYLKSHWQAADDPYALALVANALLAAAPSDPETTAVLQRLIDRATEDGDVLYWKSSITTMTYARGDASNLETTGLGALALLKWGRDATRANKVLTYLIRAKDASGTWHSTQATVLALKALLLGAQGATTTDATVTIGLDAAAQSRVRITPEDSDVVRLVDLGDVPPGEHVVSIASSGQGGMLYQIVARYYIPWNVRIGDEPKSPLSIEVVYDRQRLSKDDLVTATATIRNESGTTARMVIVDLGIPPGFSVPEAGFQALVEQGTITKYELTPRQAILYFDEISPTSPVSFSYELRAKYPIRAKTRLSRAYEYYNPDAVAVAPPIELEIAEP